ncbi:hypothetical protein N7481_009481 [Penicillium waksmanii]|uniref:uncharacterized protein n=1 Tax=Penicillium waksmanii TaxID=69791 RepID=UPI00254867E2|nr:uncharacterized protein N7481_009481 [Penicillium waksmanii]KAJ5975774.1 hypothetical protein N7481_009481 [Penicillium waksmanii]
MAMPVLPDDILLLICDHIVLEQNLDNRKGISSLLQVCRHWYSLFFSVAWRSIYVQGDQIYPLVCAIQANPKIGRSIRSLNAVWDFWGDGTVDDIEMFRSVVEETSHSPEHSGEWTKALQQGSPDAWIAVLIPSLQNVTSLCLQFHRSPTYFMSMVARAAAGEKPFDLNPIFQKLEHVTIKMEDDNKSSYSMGDLLPFFSFPAMRSFAGNAINEEDNWTYHGYPKQAPGTSGIKKLDFGDWGTCNGMNGFLGFVKLCQGLESFEFQHNDQAIWGESYYPFRPGAFYTSLSTQIHSLRVIRLNNRGEHPWHFDKGDFDEEFELGTFGSMTDFHQLRELQIPWATLLQVDSREQPTVRASDILPTSLEYLHLADCREKDFALIIEVLRDILKHREKWFANLRILEVQPKQLSRKPPGNYVLWVDCLEVPQPTIDTFAPVEIECQEKGIQFRFNKDGSHQILGPY